MSVHICITIVEGAIVDCEVLDGPPTFPIPTDMRVLIANINGGDSLDITHQFPKEERT